MTILLTPGKWSRLARAIVDIEARIDRLLEARAIRADSWNEADHPRGADGKFGSTGGGALKGTAAENDRRSKADITRPMAIAAKQSAPRNLMLVKDMEQALEEMGHTKEAIQDARQLLRMHSLGSSDASEMRKIDAEIENAIAQDTPAGRALLDGAYLEEAAYRAWQSGAKDRNIKERKKLERDYNEGFLGYYDKQDGMPFDDWIKKDYPHLNEDHPTADVYRGGELRSGVSSWTQNGNGASVGNGIRIKPEHAMTIDDALDAGAIMLGGLSRMMGSSGEAEVTMYFPPATPIADLKIRPIKQYRF